VCTLVFCLFNVLPTDPAQLTLGQRSDPKSLAQIRQDLFLDQPLHIQYTKYLNDLSPLSLYDTAYIAKNEISCLTLFNTSQGNSCVLKFPYLRKSYQSKKKVSAILTDVLPSTIMLALSALALALIIGIFLGIVAAYNKGKFLDTQIIITSILGISTMLLAYIFGYLLHNYTGLYLNGSLYQIDPFTGKHLQLKNAILPIITLGIRPMAIIAQLMRSSILQVQDQDYVVTARAKGLSEIQIFKNHIFKNALNPIATAAGGWFAELLAGSFFVEYIFGWKGLGKTTVLAVEKMDIPIVMGAVLITACFFLVINLLTNYVYTLLDPRL
jgi:peptide/nickel transport system permease protein